MKVMSNGKRFTQGATWELNEKRIKAEYVGHENAAINEIHNNPNLSREEKIAAAKAILTADKTEEPAAAAKSKVCVIANTLTKQGMNRSAAFRRAWQLIKAETVETNIAGVTYGNRQTALERLNKYDTQLISVNLTREAANEHDSNAIAVIVTVQGKGSYTVGYLPRRLAATIAPLLDAGKAVKAAFKGITGKYHNYHNHGMSVAVSV
jgi:hypothetical protein